MRRATVIAVTAGLAATLVFLVFSVGEAQARRCGGCTVTVINRTRAPLHVWVDGLYQGYLHPGGRGVTVGLGLGRHALRLRGVRGAGTVPVYFTPCHRHYSHFYGP